MQNPFISVFAQPAVLDGFDRMTDRILVKVGTRVVAEVAPGRRGVHEMAFAWEYTGATRGRDGVTPIGPAFDLDGLKRRIVSVMFNGDVEAFRAAQLVRVKR